MRRLCPRRRLWRRPADLPLRTRSSLCCSALVPENHSGSGPICQPDSQLRSGTGRRPPGECRALPARFFRSSPPSLWSSTFVRSFVCWCGSHCPGPTERHGDVIIVRSLWLERLWVGYPPETIVSLSFRCVSVHPPLPNTHIGKPSSFL